MSSATKHNHYHEGTPQPPVAIVGMDCRLPGAETLDAFWELLSSGGYAIERMPEAKLNRDLYYSAEKGVQGKTYSDIGGFVRQRDWDWSVLPIDPSEAADWDECHLNLCEVAAKACLQAGYDRSRLHGENVGVFVGHSGGSTVGGELAFRILAPDYVEVLEELSSKKDIPNFEKVKKRLLERLEQNRPRRVKGKPYSESSYAAGIISRGLGLTGPFMSIDAACASSLVALAMGVDAVSAGQVKMAIVGGASYNKADSLILFSKAQSCSASASRPFDDRADGLISSEGYVAVLIKSLQQAIEDGDPIQAVIRGIGISSDGRGRSLWAPRKEGQSEAIRRAYQGEVTPQSVQMLEAHATSTQVGDATEMEALSDYFSEHLPPGVKLPIGSVKSNIGHTLETAGLAGLIKSVLAIHNKTIPPSVNVEQLSRSIPWDDIPLYVARDCEPWPELPAGQPCRAAVNAFGIGGLNVHVVVEEYLAPHQSTPRRSMTAKPKLHAEIAKQHTPIAMVGRGVLLPGADSLEALKRLILQPVSHLRRPPSDRARAVLDWEVECGYITDYQYDWRRHRVPPRQIDQANPLQFMLLDSAEQALGEAGYLERGFDKRNTAVVVGASFGGDFANALFAGLRLPEIREHLIRTLEEHGCDHSLAIEICKDFERQFLVDYPALLDETGSFTSSTLASRLSKTFDLMGGAMAVDSGDVSGLAALDASCRLLHSGRATHVLCAAAQRALDRAALDNLMQLGRLTGVKSNGHQGCRVGEGVALIVLKRLQDARRDGDRVLGIVDAIAVANSSTSTQESYRQAAQRLSLEQSPDPVQKTEAKITGGTGNVEHDSALKLSLGGEKAKVYLSPNLPSTGHLQATQGLVDIIASSLDEATKSKRTLIGGNSIGGQSYLVGMHALSSEERSDVSEKNFVDPSYMESGGDNLLRPTGSGAPTQPGAGVVNDKQTASDTPESFELFRFEAGSLEELKKLLSDATPVSSFRQRAHATAWRATIVCKRSELRSLSARLSKQVGLDSARVPLGEQGMFWSSPEQRPQKSKIAWLFPGQGSQRPGMLRDLCQVDDGAAESLRAANKLLDRIGMPSFQEMAWKDDERLIGDLWTAQASLLVCEWVMQRVLRDRGLRPDVVSAHSYGEFAALTAVDSWDLEAALEATRIRCDCLNEYVVPGCGMLSVNRSATALQGIIEEQNLPLSVSHSNSPTQSVAGGRLEHIQALTDRLNEKRIASRLLKVPTAFHTPFLAAAVKPFQQQLNSINLDPPRIPFLSSVTKQYMAEPGDIRHSLAQQLESHLDFVSLIDRLERDGVNLIVEVGPQHVLSRLIRQITDGVAVVSMDHDRYGASRQLLCVQAAVEVYVNSQFFRRETGDSTSLLRFSPIHFDATQVRKTRLKQQSKLTTSTHESKAPGATRESIHFDATARRRDLHRARGTAVHAGRNMEAGEKSERVRLEPDAIVTASREAEPSLAESQQPANSMHKFLIDFVVEQTGYPADLLELDWDLEADLGIDSIKKAQLFGELRELLPIESDGRGNLDQFRTLRDILEFLEQLPLETGTIVTEAAPSNIEIESLSASEAPSIPSEDVHPIAAVNVEAESADAKQQDQQANQQLTQFLVDFVVEQTGYPPDIVELDADLEADLGIDSIKKAQLLGEIRELFSLNAEVIRPSQSANSSTMPEFRTLREIRDSLLAWTADSNSEVTESQTQGVLSTDDTPSGKDRVGATSDERVASPQHDIVSQQATLPQSKRGLNVEADELPTAAWNEQKDGKCSFATSQLFIDSARCNLKAFVARRGKIGSTGEENFGAETEWYSQRAKCFADALGCTADSLRLFDEALNSEGGWNFDSATDSSQSGPILWLCGLRLPVWLQHVGGTSLSLIQRYGIPSVTELLPAGALLPLATIISERLLVVVRMNSSPESLVTERQTLSRLIQQFEGHSLETLADRLRQQNVKSEWQLLAVDRVTRESFVARSSGNEIQIDFGRPCSVFDAPDCHPGWSAAIGLEQQSGNFVAWISRGYSSLASPLQVSLKNARIERPTINLDEPQCSKPNIASRYALKLVPSPARKASEPNINWGETAVVVGDNGVAQQLESRLRKDGVEVIRFSTYQDPVRLAAEFRRLTREKLVAHLFLTTPLDVDAETRLETDHWTERRNQGILGPYWLCQQWLSHIVEMQLTDHASLVAVTALGGDFGIESKPYSIEGGGLAGLLKSMLVESWTQGYRPLTIKVLDTVEGEDASQIVDHIWQELEVPSYDIEISYSNGGRHVLRAVESSIMPARPGHQTNGPTPGGVWICTGGARGITAYVAEQLAKRYQLKLHLIGKSGVPEVQPEWMELDCEGLRDLKIKVMTEARNSNQSPLETWQNTEKALEIDETLRRLRAAGIEAHYHSCDVADSAAVQEIVDRIRQHSGAIRGVLHGAGVGKDSRFDRKQVEKVEQCISAKVDGALALMEATRQDPLEFFIGFGSISGRFGANGHTDYSLANDMLCKLIDWYARLRPEVRSVGFHWHAWGDVGMATKPETRLALEMVDMQFMPAAEGVKHLVDELESGADDSEVLITDDRYYRMFYPAEHLLCEENQGPRRPEQNQQPPYDRRVQGCLLTSRVRPVSGGTRAFEARVNPSKDPFLTEHLLHGKPLLPFVVATEMLWEAALLTLSSSDIDLYSIEAISGIRFFHEAEQGLRVETAFDAEGDIQCQLFNDFISRSGRLIETDRLAFRATAKLQNNETPLASESNACVRLTPDKERKWRPVSYPPADADFYVGWPLQRLRSVQLQGDGIIGRISAPALIELAGSRRQVAAWKVPSAAMDACLFAVGILAWEHVAAGVALPVRIGRLSLGDRLPDPGEACQVHAKFKRAGQGRAVFDFSLYGIDDQLLLNAQDYEVAWLDRQEASSQSANSEVVAREDRRS